MLYVICQSIILAMVVFLFFLFVVAGLITVCLGLEEGWRYLSDSIRESVRGRNTWPGEALGHFWAGWRDNCAVCFVGMGSAGLGLAAWCGRPLLNWVVASLRGSGVPDLAIPVVLAVPFVLTMAYAMASLWVDLTVMSRREARLRRRERRRREWHWRRQAIKNRAREIL